jgi:hypothetical protein
LTVELPPEILIYDERKMERNCPGDEDDVVSGF